MSIPKYAKLENERRWLMPSSFATSLRQLPYKTIHDLYLSCGRLRLRTITDSQTGNLEFKLCKKYGSVSVVAEPIVNIYLTAEEHAAFLGLPGNKLSKKRYKKTIDGNQYTLDVYEGALSGLVICEVEADSEALLREVPAPEIAIKEVTRNPLYSGGHFCRLTPDEINKLLNE